MKYRLALSNTWSNFKALVTCQTARTVYRLVVFLGIVVAGIPVMWTYIPIEYRPQNFWDFFNSTMLCYIAWHVTVKHIGCWIKD
jgi:hypothetical protein